MTSTVPALSLSEPQRILALDGLRGVAVVLVLIHHSVCWNNGFWNLHTEIAWFEKCIECFAEWSDTGVDLFFLLSGFLITSILLRAKTRDSFYKNFYIRRVLRILPVYYLYLAMCFIALPAICKEPVIELLRQQQLFYWLHMSNWGIITAKTPGNMFLTHTWSLGIEEQFYLFWPFFVRRFSLRGLAYFSVFVAITSIVLRTVLVSSGMPLFEVKINTFCRLDCFALGALISVASVRERLMSSSAAYRIAAVGMLGVLLVKFWHFGIKDNVGQLSICAIYAALLMNALDKTTVVSRTLNNPVLKLFGKYSYSIYLIHFPLLYFLVRNISPILVTAFGCPSVVWTLTFLLVAISSLIAAAAIYHCFEKYFLQLKDYFAPVNSHSADAT